MSANRFLKHLSLGLLFIFSACTDKEIEEDKTDVVEIPEGLSEKVFQVGTKPQSAQLQQLNSLFNSLNQTAIFNMALTQMPGDSDSSLTLGLASSLQKAYTDLKNQCDFQRPKEIRTPPRWKPRTDFGGRDSSRIEGSQCPLNSVREEKFQVNVVTASSDLSVLDAKITKQISQNIGIADRSLSGKIGLTRLSMVGDQFIQSSSAHGQRQQHIQTTLNGAAQLTKNLAQFYLSLEEIATRTGGTLIKKKARAEYAVTLGKNPEVQIILEAHLENGEVSSSVRVNGHRLTQQEAPALFTAAQRLAL